MPPELQDCSGGCGTFKGDGCCEQCCDECVECFVDPCDGYTCSEHSEYTCSSNYCQGCNRDWYDPSGHKVTCNNEVFGSGGDDGGDPSDWNLDCKHDGDCTLMNTDRGFDCCNRGGCDLSDLSDNNWQPVNTIWWETKHNNCMAVSNCPAEPPIACPLIYMEPAYKAVCHHNQCSKVKVDNGGHNGGGDGHDESHSSSNAAFLAVGALMLIPIVAL